MIAVSSKSFEAALCLLLLLNGVTAFETSKLQVQIPQSLKKPGDGYDHRDAMFGVVPYGGSIQQQVYYAESTLCDQNVDKTIGYPTRPNSAEWETPFILMVDRGDCTFVQKVRNAQRAGASAVLIADDLCLCDHPECNNNEGQMCQGVEPLMGDDGSGSDISIPSFLIYKEDADAMKVELTKNVHVRVEMSFKIPAPDSRVEYELWMTPADQTSRGIERSFGPAAIALDKHAYFTPHMYVYDGIQAGCQGGLDESMCGSLCTNGGRYCSIDPDDDVMLGASGADVVVESLRRMCIWQEYGQEDGVGKAWWKYVEVFSSTCHVEYDPNVPNQPILFTDDDCISDAMMAAGVDRLAIEKCMLESGGVEGDGVNALLQDEVELQASLGIALIPSLIINDAVVRGTVTFPTALKAICSGYAPGSKPWICKECSDCSDEFVCVRDGVCSTKSSTTGVPIAVFSGFFATMLLLFAVVVYLLYKKMHAYMEERIRGVVAEYMPVGSQKEYETTSLVEERGFEDEPEGNNTDDESED